MHFEIRKNLIKYKLSEKELFSEVFESKKRNIEIILKNPSKPLLEAIFGFNYFTKNHYIVNTEPFNYLKYKYQPKDVNKFIEINSYYKSNGKLNHYKSKINKMIKSDNNKILNLGFFILKDTNTFYLESIISQKSINQNKSFGLLFS